MRRTQGFALLKRIARGDFCVKVGNTYFFCGFFAFYAAFEESEGGASVGEGGRRFIAGFL